jgi:hypothetical protein
MPIKLEKLIKHHIFTSWIILKFNCYKFLILLQNYEKFCMETSFLSHHYVKYVIWLWKKFCFLS